MLRALRLFTLTAAPVMAAACAGELPEPGALPDTLVDGRGSGDGGHLLGIQAWMQKSDYATSERFEGRLRGFLDNADAEGLIDERTVVVLPEYVGTWLVTVDEGPGVYDKATIGEAMTDLAMAHLGAFLLASWTAPATDGDAFAAFTVKAEQKAKAYDRAMSNLARDFGVTLVGGSLIVPNPTIVDGRLHVTPGDPLSNASVVYDSTGAVVAISEKVFPTADETSFVEPAAIEEIAVVDTPAGRLGVLVCADSWFPASYERLVAEGAEILAVPTFHSQEGIWEKPWGGYSGQEAPADVDLADIGALTENEAWEKYSVPTRAAAAGMRAAITAPLRGDLWDLGDDGQGFLLDVDGFQRGPLADAPALLSLRIP